MRVALCYDRINKFGGAERVLQVLHRMFPEAPIYTLTHTPSHALWSSGWNIRTSFLQRIPVLGSFHELFPPLASLAWEKLDFSEFDVVISVTSSEAKSILVKPGAIHICYCLTPTRYYWSGYFTYLKFPGLGFLDGLIRHIFPVFAYFLRVSDYYLSQRPHILVGISHIVQKRIKKYYRRDVDCIYPPVLVNLPAGYTSSVEKKYFLVVSRLVPYKRIDIVVEAFNLLGWPLVVVGSGSQAESLHNLAGAYISFRGFVADDELSHLYSEAVAVIFPSDEDFGIVPVEAQAHGIPVLALRKGGATETVEEEVTGSFFENQTAESLYNFLFLKSNGGDFSEIKAFFSNFSPDDCGRNASRFDQNRFVTSFQSLITQALKNKRL